MISQLINRLLMFIWQYVAYLDDDLYVGCWSGGRLSFVPFDDTKAPSPKIILVARKNCYETYKVLPVSSFNEARKLAGFIEFDWPFEGLVRKRLRKKGGSWHLNCTLLPQKKFMLMDTLGVRPWFVIPVVWLLADEELFTGFKIFDDALFVQERQGVLTSIHVDTLKRQNDAFDTWCWLHGINTDQSVLLSFELTLAKISNRIYRLFPLDWISALYVRTGTSDYFNWKKAGLTLGLSLLMYIGLSSLGILLADFYVKHKKDAIQSEMNLALNAKNTHNTIMHEYQLRRDLLTKYQYKWQVWYGLLDILKMEKTAILSLNLFDNTVEVTGVSLRASDVLVSISELPQVVNSTFMRPVRKNGNVESFSIRWSLPLEDYIDVSVEVEEPPRNDSQLSGALTDE